MGKKIEAIPTPVIAPNPIARGPPQFKNYSEGAIMATEARDAIVTPVAKHAYPIAMLGVICVKKASMSPHVPVKVV